MRLFFKITLVIPPILDFSYFMYLPSVFCNDWDVLMKMKLNLTKFANTLLKKYLVFFLTCNTTCGFVSKMKH